MEITVPATGPDGAVEQRTVPFVVGVLGDFSGRQGPPRRKLEGCRFVAAHRRNVDACLGDAALGETDRGTGNAGSVAGIQYLQSHFDSRANVRIKIADLTKRELQRDFQAAIEVEASWLYRRLFADAYSLSDREPMALLIVDYEFDNGRADIGLLEDLVSVAAKLFAPMIAVAGPAMLGLSSLEELPGLSDPEQVFQHADRQAWQRLRNVADARFVALTLPPVLISGHQPELLPTGPRANAPEPSGEGVSGTMSAAYLLAGRLAELYSADRWWTRLHDSEGKFHFGLDLQRPAGVGPGTVPISPDQETALSRAGFAVLSGSAADFAFHAPMSIARPPRHDHPEQTRDATPTMSVMQVMAVSRLIHHIRMAAIQFSQFATDPDDLEQILNDWLGRYVRIVHPVSLEPVDRSRPLAAGLIKVPKTHRPDEQCVVAAWVRFGMPWEVPVNTDNTRLVFELPSARWLKPPGQAG